MTIKDKESNGIDTSHVRIKVSIPWLALFFL